MKRFLQVSGMLISMAAVCPAGAQFDTSWTKSNIRRCADSLTTGFKLKDWDLYARYSYPAMIGSMGGVEAFKKFTAQTFAQIPDTCWKKYEAGKVLQVIKTPGDMQAVIELTSVLHWQGMRITTTACLIGESWDGGSFWRFFGSDGDKDAARLVKPDLADLLVIPAKKEKKEPLGKTMPKKE